MFRLLEIREKIKKIYQDGGVYVIPLFKFMFSFVVFLVIGCTLNYNEMLSSPLVALILALIGAFVPGSILVLMAALMSVGQIFYFSSIVAASVAVILIILYCLLLRFTPKLGYAVVAIPVMYVLKMPVLVPIILGLIAGVSAIVPVICGVIVFFLFSTVKSISLGATEDELEEAIKVYTRFIDLLKNNDAIVFSIIVFCIIMLIVYLIRTRRMAHSFEIAIVAGGVVYMISFLIGNLVLDSDTGVRVVSLLFGTIFACTIAYIVQFFKFVLDYSAVENVQFEDDDYLYYVKAVPKLKVEAEQADIKRISIQRPTKYRNKEKIQNNNKENAVEISKNGVDNKFEFDNMSKEFGFEDDKNENYLDSFEKKEINKTISMSNETKQDSDKKEINETISMSNEIKQDNDKKEINETISMNNETKQDSDKKEINETISMSNEIKQDNEKKEDKEINLTK